MLTKATLCIFVKPPLPGLVKTRLSRCLTAAQAAGLARRSSRTRSPWRDLRVGAALSWHATEIRRR